MELDFGDPRLFSIIIVCICISFVWELVWKGFALWKAARNNHIVWFVCIMIFNTVGILPIIYLLLNRTKNE
jgi:hypothetical protein